MSSKTELINELGYEDLVLLEPRQYLDDAIVGLSHDNKVIYDYNKLIECFKKGEGWTDEEAIEWVDYNTLRALPYEHNSPIILFGLDKYE